MNRRKKIEVNTNEVPQKDVFKCVVSLIFIFIHNFYINVKYSLHTVSDFIFKRYSWYRKSRGTFSVRIMTKSHGDARNHAYNGWRIYKGDLELPLTQETYKDMAYVEAEIMAIVDQLDSTNYDKLNKRNKFIDENT